LNPFACDVTPVAKKILGLHHVTAIASDPQRNLDFYVGLPGLRFVKRTVNFDDPGTYHFYSGDQRGTPGTILTFFPWPDARPGIRAVSDEGSQHSDEDCGHALLSRVNDPPASAPEMENADHRKYLSCREIL